MLTGCIGWGGRSENQKYKEGLLQRHQQKKIFLCKRAPTARDVPDQDHSGAKALQFSVLASPPPSQSESGPCVNAIYSTKETSF